MQFSLLFSPKGAKTLLKTLFGRFPIPATLIFVLACFLVYLYSYIQEEVFMNILLLFLCVTLLSTGVALFRESTKKQSKFLYLLYFLPAFYGVFFFLQINGLDLTPSSYSRFLLNWIFQFSFGSYHFFFHLIGFLSFLFVAPFILSMIRRNFSPIAYQNYSRKLIRTIFLSTFFSLILWILGVLIYMGIDILLFSLDSIQDLFVRWGIFVITLFAGWYFLGTFPQQIQPRKNEAYDTTHYGHFATVYLFVPFLYISGAILLIYIVKTLFLQYAYGGNPFNDFTYVLIVLFIAIGYLVHFCARPYIQGHSLVRVFHILFPWVTIPFLAVLGIEVHTIFVETGLSGSTYVMGISYTLVCLFSLYFVLSRTKNIFWLPTILTLTTLFFSVGHFSVFTYPISYNYTSLIHLLEKNNLLQDGKLVTIDDTNKITDSDVLQNILTKIRYIANPFSFSFSQYYLKDREQYYYTVDSIQIYSQASYFDPYSSRVDNADTSDKISLSEKELNLLLTPAYDFYKQYKEKKEEFRKKAKAKELAPTAHFPQYDTFFSFLSSYLSHTLVPFEISFNENDIKDTPEKEVSTIDEPVQNVPSSASFDTLPPFSTTEPETMISFSETPTPAPTSVASGSIYLELSHDTPYRLFLMKQRKGAAPIILDTFSFEAIDTCIQAQRSQEQKEEGSGESAYWKAHTVTVDGTNHRAILMFKECKDSYLEKDCAHEKVCHFSGLARIQKLPL